VFGSGEYAIADDDIVTIIQRGGMAFMWPDVELRG